MRLYLAGPMRGYPDFNFPIFMQVGQLLEDAGHEVLNPAANDILVYGADAFVSETGDLADIRTDFDLRSSLAADLEFICTQAEGVAVLDDWQESSGAKAEVATALALGIPVYHVVIDEWHSMVFQAELVEVRPSITARTLDPEIAR